MRTRLSSKMALGLVLALAFFLVGLPFLYRDGLVEADGVRVSYGIANAIRSGDGLAARDLYGRSFSFGYYALFLAVYPLLWDGFAPLVACMNTLNLICVAAAFVPLVLWMSTLWGRGVALAAATLLATTPVVFELGGAGHPEGPAWLALNATLALLVSGLSPQARPRPWLLILAGITGFLALTLRADVLLAFPLFPFLGAMAAAPGRRRRAVTIGLLVALLAVAAFLATQATVVARMPPRATPVPDGTLTGKANALTLLLEYLAGAKEAGRLVKGVAVWATGIGPLLLATGLLGTAAAFRRRDRTFAGAAGAVLAVNGLFWLPDPSPARHFLMSFLVLVPAAVLSLAERVPGRRFAAAVALLLALNLASMAAAYPIVVRNYDFPFVTLLPRRVSTSVPMGDPISNRIWTRRQVRMETAEARQLAATAERRVLIIGHLVPERLVYEVFAYAPSYASEFLWLQGVLVRRLITPKTEYWIYGYSGEQDQVTPQELMERIAAAGELTDFAIAIVPSDQPTVGAARVPPGYREFPFTLDMPWLER